MIAQIENDEIVRHDEHRIDADDLLELREDALMVDRTGVAARIEIEREHMLSFDDYGGPILTRGEMMDITLMIAEAQIAHYRNDRMDDVDRLSDLSGDLVAAYDMEVE